MRINVFGMGYVGTVVSIGLANMGHDITGIDIVPEKVDKMNRGELDIYEPGLAELFTTVLSNETAGSFNCINQLGLHNNVDVSIACVGTPSMISGYVDLEQIKATTQIIGDMLKHSTKRHEVIIRSTIPPGTTENVIIPLLEETSGKQLGEHFSVCFYPEFLREGHAVHDFIEPSLNIVGSDDPSSVDLISAVFKDVKKAPVWTEFRTAEMIKYTNNTFHALKVAFVNEIATVGKAYGVNTDELMDIFSSDTVLNISPYYLRPGFAFGGSCLPKELRGIVQLSMGQGVTTPLLNSILPSNEEHINRLVSILTKSSGHHICFLGVTFKQDTDDIRESPILSVIQKLLHLPSYKASKEITICDQKKVCQKVQRVFGDRIKYTTMQDDLAESSEVIVLGPLPIEPKIMDELINFTGVVVDLKWYLVPETMKRLSGYMVIC